MDGSKEKRKQALSLKQKTIRGLFWSFWDNFFKLGVQFIVGLILARLLEPREFGLIGMLTIFIAISQTFINSGFSAALIRKKQVSSTDYSTVFYFNLLVAIILYVLLFFASGSIARFFGEPELKALLKILGFGLILSSLGIVQQTILTREINFKVQTKVSIVSSVSSGIIAVIMAFMGLGVWSLVALSLCQFGFNSLFLWIWSSWKPVRKFSTQSFKVLFAFGSKLLLSGLIDTIYKNVYLLVIGKYFTAQELGYYTRADQFKNLPSNNIMNVIQRVSFPVLSSIQEDKERLKTNYQKLIRNTMFATFLLMLGMAAVAKPMILALIGEKWLPSVAYLQLLCFAGMLYPLHALNLNMLNVKGRSDLILRLEIIKKLIAVPIIVIGIYYGIKAMIIGMIANGFFSFFLNSYYSGQLIGYSTKQQILDIFPAFVFATFISTLVYLLGLVLPFGNWGILIFQIITGGSLVILLGELLHLNDYVYIKQLIIEQFNSLRNSAN